MKLIRYLIPIFVFVTGCSYVPASNNKADWYATLENGGPEKLPPVSEHPGTVCLQICRKSWEPLFGVDGPGGPREGYVFWSNLSGEGPVYRDPELHESSLSHPFPNRGTITIDKKNKRVTIDLQRIVSKPGEPEKLETSPANGTYPIRRWIE